MLEISKEDVVARLRRDNPWWEQGVHARFRPYEKKRAYFQPFFDLVSNWKVQRSIILMGPRRIGKTVMLHQLVQELLKQSIKPDCIFFASIDTPLLSGTPLEALVDLFEEETGCNDQDQKVVIFDEIQYLKDWEIHLKVLTDRYPLIRFVASGSAAAALRLKSQESGAGRFTHFILPPLTFSEYLNFSDKQDVLFNTEQVDGQTLHACQDIEALNREFIQYLNYGGYPEAVFSEEVRQHADRYLGQDIIDKVLLRDLPSLYGIQDIQELNRLFTTLAYHTGQEVSLQKLSEKSGVAKQTISRYLEYLEAAFLITRVNRVDQSGKTFKRINNFKVYLTNPTIRAALFGPASETDRHFGNIVETAYFGQWFHLPMARRLHYARWKQSNKDLEVDLVFLNPALEPEWIEEIKWSDRIVNNPSDLKGALEFSRRNKDKITSCTVTTRTIRAEQTIGGVEVLFIPCAMQCFYIGQYGLERKFAAT